MFILSEIEDLIRIPPQSFNIPIQHSLTDELNKKYANKVIPNLGLVITTWDLLDIKDGLLKPGDGGSYVSVRFRCIVFKPFRGEVLTGWITENNAKGIKVRLEFFDDIWIPAEYLFENCEFGEKEKAWIWKTDESELYLDINERIRFRVEQENFYNVKPKTSSEASGLEEPKEKLPAYSITASCQAPGMGCVSWWE
ncbi:DNA-directed RNA polymerase III complex subunit Rpc25 [Lodderomyces elongisporus]|uniref:DNA-directed RNA polymerase III complex subunit Rpc25 n=1 Tax=Lodderomyces elongisporus TaxID=36914 RepID=UPI002924E5E8|nr:DNA-directed RNA polymerase III complex subunit Rpc25 [Lodderomyces elongisporus]WLF78018.1 DNA-directed RNA polymerase III complex subunit Rpc25 [Lodderomyces elongisporus]